MSISFSNIVERAIFRGRQDNQEGQRNGIFRADILTGRPVGARGNVLQMGFAMHPAQRQRWTSIKAKLTARTAALINLGQG